MENSNLLKDNINLLEKSSNLVENYSNLLDTNLIDKHLKSLNTNSLETFMRMPSELQLNHQNRESHIGLIKEFLDSVYQDIIDND